MSGERLFARFWESLPALVSVNGKVHQNRLDLNTKPYLQC